MDLMALAGPAGSVAGSLLGGLAAGGSGSSTQPDVGQQITQMVNQQNGILNEYLQKAIKDSTGYTATAVNATNAANTNAQNTLSNYLTNATNTANQQSQQGNALSRATASPVIGNGLGAQDALMDSLGLRRPVIGTAALQNALQAPELAKQGIAALGTAVTNPGQFNGQTPTLAGNVDPNSLGTQSVIDYIKRQGDSYMNSLAPNWDAKWNTANYVNSNTRAALANELNASHQQQYQQQQQQYAQQQQQYQGALQNYNNYQGQVQGVNNQYMTPQVQSILQAYNSGKFN